MTRKAVSLTAAALLALSLLNCRVKKVERLPPEQVLPLQSASLAELVARLEKQAGAVTSINAVTELVPSTGSAYSGVIEQYHDVRAFVLAQRGPGSGQQIRLIGQAPVVRKNIFDMVANEKEFRISVPPKNKFIVGPTALNRRSDKPIENLRPQHLFEALFLEAPSGEVFLEENEWAGRRYYGVSEVAPAAEGGTRIQRRWWFERTALELVRVQRFGPAGELLTDVHYGKWQETEGIRYPHEIELLRPHDDYRLKLLVEEVQFNQPLGPEKFQLEQPAGFELVRLTEKAAGTEPVPAEEPR